METDKKEGLPPQTAQIKAGWRIKMGFTIFTAAIGWPLLLPILPLFGISSGSIGTFTGFMLVAAELMMVAAAAVSGKDGFAYIKKQVFGFLKSYGPPQVVGAARYKIGLVMFTAPLLFAFLSPYSGKYIPGLAGHRVLYALVGDILLLVGLFLLGGNFWDKLHSLFVREAKPVFPPKNEK